MNTDLEKVILSADEINTRVQEIALEINQNYEGSVREVILITLLDGAIVFTADLIRHLSVPIRLDCIRVSSYGNSTNPETAPRILGSLKSDVEDKHVLLVDDILDTGNTMKKVVNEVSAQKPASLRTCVFLDKPERRQNNFQADWSGFNIPDEFVVGYGLDYAGRYRELPYLGTLRPEIYSHNS
ncbi:MAG: hypoxanthine phosphoribosyltransferase [Opitutales bacterium]|nr:hypoxanthine phosphoribosyltransferase [Opitutales bacterium]